MDMQITPQIEPQKTFTLVDTDPKIPDGMKTISISIPKITSVTIDDLKKQLEQCNQQVIRYQEMAVQLQSDISTITSQFNLKI